MTMYRQLPPASCHALSPLRCLRGLALPALLLCLLPAAAPGLAAESAGESATASVADAELTSRATAERARLQGLLDMLAADEDADPAALSETQLALARQLQLLGEHAEALPVLDQALQARRIHFGLLDVGQLPVLQAMIDSRSALAAWKEVDDLQHQRHFMTTRQLQAGADARFSALVELGRWKRRATEDALLSPTELGVEELLRYYQSEITALEALGAGQRDALQLATLYLHKAETDLQQANVLWSMPISDFDPSGPQTVREVRCLPLRLPDGRVQQVCEAYDVPNLNYYLLPNQRKSQGIYRHIENVQADVMEAFNVLQEVEETSERRTALLEDVHRLAADYNAFVAKAQTQGDSRIVP